MPSFPRKKFTRKRFKRRSMRGGVARKALAGVRFLKSIVNVEKHFFDTAVTGVSYATTGLVYPLDNLVQGDAFNNRAGNSILAKSFYIVISNSAALVAMSNAQFRVMLILDKENRSALPAVTDVIETATTISPINHTNGKRFKIIRDTRVQFSASGATSKTLKYYCKLNNHIRYNDGNAGTVADFREGHYFLLFIADSVSIAYSFYARLRYIDN